MPHLRFLLPIILLLVSTGFHAQELLIAPRWQKGDIRSLFVTRVQTEVENGEMTQESTERLDAKVRVTTVTASTYMVELEYRNVILTQFQELGGVMGAEMDPWKRMVLRYEVDRRSGEAMLYNWEDVREMVNGSFSEIKRSLRKKDPELADTMLPMLEVLTSMFQDRTTVDAYFRDPIDMLTFAFGKPLTMGQPLVLSGSSVNPFGNGTDTLTVVTTVHLEALDRDAQRCTIRSTEVWEMEPFLAMMKDMMMGMMKTMKADKSAEARSKAEMDKAFAEMKFDLTKEQTIVMDLERTWPVRAERSTTLVSNTPDGSSIRTILLNAEVR